MKRYIATIIILCITSLLTDVFAAGKAVSTFVNTHAADSASMAVVIIDLSTGKVDESYNADKPLVPASVMKAVTVGSLIGETGIEFRYKTRVYVDGGVEDDVLNGNIIIVGAGDPSLNSVSAPQSPDFIAECVGALKNKGITTVRGRVIVDQSIFTSPSVPDSWPDADRRAYYGAGSFGLNFENNKSGDKSVANPAGVFESKLRSRMSSNGMSILGESIKSGDRKLLFEHSSATIDEIMRSCMMRSDNLFAESFLRTYALKRGKKGDTSVGAELERTHWAGRGLDMTGVNIIDGSGLSRSNRLTASFLANVLLEMSSNVDYVSFFPLAGEEGTLKKFLRGTPLEGYIALKTGSMHGIQCYAGYKLDDDYAPTHVVVIMINNLKDRAAVKAAAEEMLLSIFATS